MKQDPGFDAVMRYCGPRSIPYEDFLDWGQLSKDAALAWQAREDERCSGCGQLHSDWHDEHGKELEDWPFFPKDVVCPSCRMLELYEVDLPTTGREGVKIVFAPPEIADDWDEDASDSGDGDDAE